MAVRIQDNYRYAGCALIAARSASQSVHLRMTPSLVSMLRASTIANAALYIAISSVPPETLVWFALRYNASARCATTSSSCIVLNFEADTVDRMDTKNLGNVGFETHFSLVMLGDLLLRLRADTANRFPLRVRDGHFTSRRVNRGDV